MGHPLEYEVPTKYGLVRVTGKAAADCRRDAEGLAYWIQQIELSRDFMKEMKMEKVIEINLEDEFRDAMAKVSKLGGDFNGVKLMELLGTFKMFSDLDKTLLIHRISSRTLLPIDFLTNLLSQSIIAKYNPYTRDEHTFFVKWLADMHPDGVDNPRRNDLYMAYRAGWNSALNPIPDTLTKD